jgi:beta-glucanase (GH16 family)
MNLLKQYDRQHTPRSGRSWLAILAGGCVLCAAQAQTIPGWELVWNDEFSQADGSAPDPTKWGHDIGGSGWGNSELQYYTSRTNNARIEGGHLVLEALEEAYGERDYTSARLLTKHKSDWNYGRMEARLKVPRGQGLWPAFWMLGTNISTVGWPRCGEIDIMENIGREPRIVHGTVHGPGYSGGEGVGGPHTAAADLADEFHVYAVEWETNVIRWYYDDVHYFSVTPENLGESAWVFDHPHFILLNVAVGGGWPGNPDKSTLFPQQMRVDYVRVYARTEQTDRSLESSLQK